MLPVCAPRRAVVCAAGSGGDVIPFIEIARALAARGVETTLLGPARYRTLLGDAAVSYRSIGADDVFDDVFNRPEVWTARHGLAESWRYYAEAARTGLTQLRQGWNPADTVLVSSSFAVAARLAEELDGFRNLTVHLSPSIVWSARRPPRWPAASIPPGWPYPARRLAMSAAEWAFVDPVIKRALNPLRQARGLAPVSRIFSRWVHGGQVAYAFPRWFAEAANDWPSQGQFAGFVMPAAAQGGLAPELARFVSAGQSVAVITAGTAVAERPQWVARACEAALAELYRVVLVSRDPAPIAHPDVLSVPYAPFDQLLPRAGLLIHHGGIGTMAQGLEAGVAQLMVPVAHDQPDNAQRLQALGAGLLVKPHANVQEFRHAIRQVHSPATADAVWQLHGKMKQENGAAAIAGMALATDPA